MGGSVVSPWRVPPGVFTNVGWLAGLFNAITEAVPGHAMKRRGFGECRGEVLPAPAA